MFSLFAVVVVAVAVVSAAHRDQIAEKTDASPLLERAELPKPDTITDIKGLANLMTKIYKKLHYELEDIYNSCN